MSTSLTASILDAGLQPVVLLEDPPRCSNQTTSCRPFREPCGDSSDKVEKQLDDIYTVTRQAITKTDALHNKKDNNFARKKQQQLINKAPKKAHKEIFQDKNAQPQASLQAVKDPETGKLKLSPPNKPRSSKITYLKAPASYQH